MEDRKGISIGKLAALERARALGLPVTVPRVSAFEHEAREWKRQSEGRGQRAEDGGRKTEVGGQKSAVGSQRSEVRGRRTEEGGRTSEVQGEMFQIGHPACRESDDREKREGFEWKPYQSEQGEDKNKTRDLNPASVSLMARKIMAREWAMALGRGRGPETEQANFERQAEEYRKKEAAERERKEIEDRRAHRQRAALEAALRDFGRNLLEAPKPVSPETAETLLEKSLGKVGATMRIAWEKKRCEIFFEPWEEERLRRKNRETVPVLYQATIDNHFVLRSFEKIHDPRFLQEAKNDLILKNILSSFRKLPIQNLHSFKNAVSECGRIIRSTNMNGGCKINFEPWEEVRKRNVERKGQLSIITYVIKADNKFKNISCQKI